MNRPIFIFSAGWRSGSTLLQRMITASGEALIWGETGGALENIAEALERYEQMLGPGGTQYKYGLGGNGDTQYQQLLISGKENVHNWVACMNPPGETFLDALRDFFKTAYAAPAAELGYQNWGVKEVQSGIEGAYLIKRLYPEAKFIFLIRNPLDCITSIKRRNWMYHRGDVDPLTYYSAHWKRLASGFRKAEFGFRVRYEDLLSSPRIMDELVNYLGVSLPADFTVKSQVDWKAENNQALTFFERKRMLRIVGEEMEMYGYR